MAELYQLRCRECGKLSGNAPRSFCEDCFSPLEVTYDYDALKSPSAATRSPPAHSTSGATPNCFPSLKISVRPFRLAAPRSSPRLVLPRIGASLIFTSKTTPSASPRFLSKTASSPSRSPPPGNSASTPSAAPPRAISPTPSLRRPSALASTLGSSFLPTSSPQKFSPPPSMARASRASPATTITSAACARKSPTNSTGASSMSTCVPILGRESRWLLAHFYGRQAHPRPLRAAEAEHHCPLPRHRQPRRRSLRHQGNPRKWRLGRGRNRRGNRRRYPQAGSNRRHLH